MLTTYSWDKMAEGTSHLLPFQPCLGRTGWKLRVHLNCCHERQSEKSVWGGETLSPLGAGFLLPPCPWHRGGKTGGWWCEEDECMWCQEVNGINYRTQTYIEFTRISSKLTAAKSYFIHICTYKLSIFMSLYWGYSDKCYSSNAILIVHYN